MEFSGCVQFEYRIMIGKWHRLLLAEMRFNALC